MTKPKFLMATNGHCFFCLQSPKSIVEGETIPPIIVTLQNMFQYLKINFKEVYSEASAVPLSSSCLEVLGRSEVQGTLCSDCAQLSDHFSRYFLELELIEIKLLSYLKSIHNKMTEAMGRDGGRCLEEFKEEMLSRPETFLQYKVVEGIRVKTVDKCNRKLSNALPQVKLKRLVDDKEDSTTEQNTEESGRVAEHDQKQEHSKNATLPLSYVCFKPPQISAVTRIEETANYNQEPTEDNHHPLEEINNPSSSTPLYTMHMPLSGLKDLGDARATSEKIVGKTVEIKDYQSCSFSRNPMTGRYKCTQCSNEFKTHWSLKVHFSSVHLKLKFKCSICSRSFASKGKLSEHQRCVHFGQTYRCKFCSKTFNSSGNRGQHMRMYCAAAARPQPKQPDNSKWTGVSTGVPTGSHDDPTTQVLTFLKSPITGHYKCPECPMGFADLWQGRAHFMKIHLKLQYKCSKCDRTFSEESQLNHHRQVFHRSYSCKFCSKSFHFSRNLELHMDLHCPKRKDLHPNSGSQRQLPLTLTSTSQGLTLYECDLCNRKFGASELLLDHKKDVHKCRFCVSTYVHRSSKDRHERACTANLKNTTPSQEESHSRDGNPMNVDEDLMILPNDMDEGLQDEEGTSLAYDAPLPPEMCPEEARSEPSVISTSASNILTLFECGVCDRKFGASELLSSHMKDVHNCSLCGKSYMHKRNKKWHERSCSAKGTAPTTPSQEESHSRDGNLMNVTEDLMILPNDGDEEPRDEEVMSLPDDVQRSPEMCLEEAQVDPLSLESAKDTQDSPQPDKQLSTKDEPDSESDVEIITDFGPTTQPIETRSTFKCQFCDLLFDSEEEVRKHTSLAHLTNKRREEWPLQFKCRFCAKRFRHAAVRDKHEDQFCFQRNQNF